MQFCSFSFGFPASYPYCDRPLFILYVHVSQWAHFPHIHYGLMPDQTVKKTNVCQQVTSYAPLTLLSSLFGCRHNNNNNASFFPKKNNAILLFCWKQSDFDIWSSLLYVSFLYYFFLGVQQGDEVVRIKDGLLSSPNVGVSHY